MPLIIKIHSELNQQNFSWFNHKIYLLYGQQNVLLIQQNIWLSQPNCLVVLIKSAYLVDTTKKCISINQNLFDWFNQIFVDIQQNSFVDSRKNFFYV